MNDKLTYQKQIDSLTKELSSSKSSLISVQKDFKSQSTLLISFIEKLSQNCKGTDVSLDNKLAKLRKTFSKPVPFSELETQINTISSILNKQANQNDKTIREVHEKLKNSGLSLQKQNGLPSDLRRSLRTLLLETELHKDSLTQYVPIFSRLLALYEALVKTSESNEKTNTTKDANSDVVEGESQNSVIIADQLLVKRFITILNNLSLSELHAAKISKIKAKLDQKMTSDTLLKSFLTAFDVIIEDLQEEKNTAKVFLFTLSETLSSVQSAVKSTLSSCANASEEHQAINDELHKEVKDMSRCVNSALSLSDVKIELDTKLQSIVDALSKKASLEESQQEALQNELNSMTVKVNELEKQSLQFEKKIKEQQAKSMQDALTKLGNRAAFDEHFQKEMVKYHNQNFSLAIAVLDLDDFKRINDTYGHTAGDKTLQVIANTLKKSLSEDAFIGRYGGEEFVIVFSGFTPEQVQQKLTMVKQKIAKLPFKFKNNNVSITTSIGVSNVKSDDNVHLAFERADNALYQAKDAGKNSIIYV